MKFIDALDEVQKDTSGEVYRIEIAEILQYLDDHPELTGKAITESELEAMSSRKGISQWAVRALAEELGHPVVPDPKPTNLELLQALSREWMRISKGDFVDFLDERGVKAPGGDDE